MPRLAYFALLFATLAACATDPADATRNAAATGGTADGDVPTITFAADYSEAASGDLLAGGTVRVVYDLARLTTCRAERDNSEVWSVTGWAQFDDEAPISFPVSQLVAGAVEPVDAELPLPASAMHVAFWFSSSNYFGCHAYDSDYGANYHFDLDRDGLGAVLAFATDWSETQSAPIHAGDQIVVHYEPDRLRQCAGSRNGNPAWAVTGHWQVDGGAVHDIAVTRPASTFLVPADPIVTVPPGHDLALWFEATSAWGCHAWDSSYGANYHFAVE